QEVVGLEADETRLLAADPGLVPGDLDLGDDLAVLDAVAARIGDHGLERLRALFIGLRNWPAFRSDDGNPAAFPRRNLIALRVLALDRRTRLCLLVLVDHRDQLPGADDPGRVVGPCLR